MSGNEFEDAETTAVPVPTEDSGSETKVFTTEQLEAETAAKPSNEDSEQTKLFTAEGLTLESEAGLDPPTEDPEETKLFTAESLLDEIDALTDPPTQPVDAELVDDTTNRVLTEQKDPETEEIGGERVAKLQKTVIRAPASDQPARPFPQRSGGGKQIAPDAKTEFSGTQIPRMPEQLKESRKQSVRRLMTLVLVGVLMLVITASLIVIFS